MLRFRHADAMGIRKIVTFLDHMGQKSDNLFDTGAGGR